MAASVKGGDRFARELAKIERRLGADPYVRVGFAEGSTYPDGTSLPLVAAVNEFGAPSRGIPPRPFMRNTVRQHGKDWPRSAAALLKANDFDAKKTLAQVGEGIKGQLQDTIHAGVPPPNAPSTLRRKQFAKVAGRATGGTQTLIDTGFMWQHITVEVKDGEEGGG